MKTVQCIPGVRFQKMVELNDAMPVKHAQRSLANNEVGYLGRPKPMVRCGYGIVPGILHRTPALV